MSEPFVGEIRMFAGNYAPRGWALCDGQLLSTSQNGALFSLLGTIYGGDGTTTYGLPDLRGRAAMHAGSGPGLTPRRLGAKVGEEHVTLLNHNFPDHSHDIQAVSALADSDSPVGRMPAEARQPIYAKPGTFVSLPAGTIQSVGGNQAHENMQSWLCINFIIALVGIFPSRH